MHLRESWAFLRSSASLANGNPQEEHHMPEKIEKSTRRRKRDEHLGDTSPTDMVKMTVTLPRSVAAFLRWKAEVEGIKRDELLRRIITHYAKKLKEREYDTPPVTD